MKEKHIPYLVGMIWPNVIGAIDGTYFYCEKSADFNGQRRTFSGHKKRNLVKFMGIVFPDGTIYDMLGPFYADGDHSDEWMWEWIQEENEGRVNDFFDEEDEFFADRGFLQCQGGYILHCPSGLAPGQKQLSTSEANNSRLVTRFRNVVERVFGRLKMHWKILFNLIETNWMPNLSKIVRVLAAIENAFYGRIWKNQESDEMDYDSLIDRNLETNELSTLTSGWKRVKLEEIQNDFPKYSMDDIHQWCIGPYSISLSEKYLDHSAEIEIWKHKKQKDVVKITQITSRYSKTDSIQPKHYSVILQFPNKNQDITEVKTYCTCKTGMQTLGGCVHATAVLCKLTVDRSSIGDANESPTAKMKMTTVQDIRPFKIQKMEEKKKESQELQENEEDGVEY